MPSYFPPTPPPPPPPSPQGLQRASRENWKDWDKTYYRAVGPYLFIGCIISSPTGEPFVRRVIVFYERGIVQGKSRVAGERRLASLRNVHTRWHDRSWYKREISSRSVGNVEIVQCLKDRGALRATYPTIGRKYRLRRCGNASSKTYFSTYAVLCRVIKSNTTAKLELLIQGCCLARSFYNPTISWSSIYIGQ